MSISVGLGSYPFCQKMETTRPVRVQMDGKVSISRQNRQFSFLNNMIKALFPILYLDLAFQQ